MEFRVFDDYVCFCLVKWIYFCKNKVRKERSKKSFEFKSFIYAWEDMFGKSRGKKGERISFYLNLSGVKMLDWEMEGWGNYG